MCAILDTNAAHEVFGSNAKPPTEAGEEFFQWLNRGKGNLVVGGKLKQELYGGVPKFCAWANQAILAGQLVNIDDDRVNNKTDEIRKCDILQSDDPHIIALAQVSGARLLFSNDQKLHEDFRNSDIISNPRGKVYSATTTDRRKGKLLEQNHCKPRGK